MGVTPTAIVDQSMSPDDRANQPEPPRRALLIGNSDGIGLAWTRRLVAEGWSVASLSRRDCPVEGVTEHILCDVCAADYPDRLGSLLQAHGPFDVCAFLVATAVDFDPSTFAGEVKLVHTNFLAMVQAMAEIVPSMVARGQGHFIGISSQADELLVADCPGYPASKAAISSYLTGCAKPLRAHGVAVTNVRFGFVDTKLAQAPIRPMLATPERAVDVLMRCIQRRPVQLSWPKTIGFLVRIGRWLQRPGVWLRHGPGRGASASHAG